MVIETDASARGWGAHCHGGLHGRSMEQVRTISPHKLLRTPRRFLCDPVLRKGQNNRLHLSVDGQCDSSSLCQQNGGGKVSNSGFPCNGPLAVVPSEEHHSPSTSHPRDPKCESRLGVESTPRLLRLETLPISVSGSVVPLGTLRSRYICLASYSSASPICELETRPTCRSSRCLLSSVVRSEGLYLSPILPGRQVSSAGSEPTSASASINCTSVEGPALVFPPVRSADRPPHSSPSVSESTNTGGDSSSSSTPAVGRMAYLGDHYKEGFSLQARDLLLEEKHF